MEGLYLNMCAPHSRVPSYATAGGAGLPIEPGPVEEPVLHCSQERETKLSVFVGGPILFTDLGLASSHQWDSAQIRP